MYKGKKRPECARYGKHNSMFGKHHSEEHKRKLSESAKAYWAKRRVMNYVTTTHP